MNLKSYQELKDVLLMIIFSTIAGAWQAQPALLRPVTSTQAPEIDLLKRLYIPRELHLKIVTPMYLSIQTEPLAASSALKEQEAYRRESALRFIFFSTPFAPDLSRQLPEQQRQIYSSLCY